MPCACGGARPKTRAVTSLDVARMTEEQREKAQAESSKSLSAAIANAGGGQSGQ